MVKETRKEKKIKIFTYDFIPVDLNEFGCKIKKLNPTKEFEQFNSYFVNEFSTQCIKHINEYKEKQPKILLELLVKEFEMKFQTIKPAIGFKSLKIWLKNGIGMNKLHDTTFNTHFKWKLLEKGFKTLHCSKRIEKEKLIIIQDFWEYRT